MRKLLLCFAVLFITYSAFSQLSVSAGATYSRFLNDYKKNTPGFQTRLQYEKGAYGFSVGYSYYKPFQFTSTTIQYQPSGSSFDPNPPKRTLTEMDFRFQSIDFFVLRSILSNRQSRTKLYGGLGASLMLLKYEETAAGSNPGTILLLENDQHNNISVNGILGGEYKLGKVSLFTEASYSLPTKETEMRYKPMRVEAARLGLQIGFKIPLM